VHSAGPRTGLGYTPRDAVACPTRTAEKLRGPWPGGPVQRRSGPHANAGSACATTCSPTARWQLAGGKMYPRGTNGSTTGGEQRLVGVPRRWWDPVAGGGGAQRDPVATGEREESEGLAG
jgi:hypothetical protein